MASPAEPYSRVYWKIVEDERFETIYANDNHLAAWLRLLLVADASWPASAQLPAAVKRASLTALTGCGLVEIIRPGVFRVHGLDAERGRRAETGRNAAAKRWDSERTADALPTHSGRSANPMLAETSLAKTRQDELSAHARRTQEQMKKRREEWTRETGQPWPDDPPLS